MLCTCRFQYEWDLSIIEEKTAQTSSSFLHEVEVCVIGLQENAGEELFPS